MNNLRAFKSCLIAGWPEANVAHCAEMVMLDAGVPIDRRDSYSYEQVKAWVAALNMFTYLDMTVSEYIAHYYERTNEALFSGVGSDAALAIFLKEKRKAASQHRASRTRYRGGVTVFVKARELNKRHDWNTVK